MRPLRSRLQEARQRLGVPWDVLERDYLLSWVLAGINCVPALSDTLVFKGGTALRKCYFGDYRFSEDLDFSGLDGVPTGHSMERLVQEACTAGERLLDEYAAAEIKCERYTERDPHPRGQEAFSIRARLPWHNQPHTRVMIEVTVDEPVLRPIEKRRVIHEYGEPIETDIRVYALEEVVAEKLRAILQQAVLLRSRGWGRSRARDYYDLWRILSAYPKQLDFTDFAVLLHAKCDVRHVAFESHEDFFPESILSDLARTWQQWLDPLVPRLPAFDTVIGELRPQVAALIS